MFIKSAASYTDQGKAIHSINERWGQQTSCGTRRQWEGRETIGIQVCKKKYSPFLFTIETLADDENDVKNSDGTSKGEKKQFVKVVRLFGCPHHSRTRKEKITCHGVRKGWEPFGQWSLRKAQELARKETIRLNNGDSNNGKNPKGDNGDKKVAALTNSGKDSSGSENETFTDDIKTICHNGKCIWKKRNKYDNVYCELTGYSESSSEEDA